MILLINCYEQNREKRIRNFVEFFEKLGNVKVINDEDFKPDPFAKIYVISGSEKYVSKNEFNVALFEFLKETKSSVIGVCYGHHLIAKAFGAKVIMGEEYIKREFYKNPEIVKLIKRDEIFKELLDEFEVDESHKDHVVETESFRREMETLAYSESCGVEVIKHIIKPIFGFQFHIERSGVNGEIILRNILNLLKKRGNI
ncbi:MAG: glutamine amidotransferase-related protein [Candidatus Aminicenantia bacterium]